MAGKEIIVRTTDINTESNGSGGYELTYYGNKQWFAYTHHDPLPIDTALQEFVDYLNSIPIREQ